MPSIERIPCKTSPHHLVSVDRICFCRKHETRFRMFVPSATPDGRIFFLAVIPLFRPLLGLGSRPESWNWECWHLALSQTTQLSTCKMPAISLYRFRSLLCSWSLLCNQRKHRALCRSWQNLHANGLLTEYRRSKNGDWGDPWDFPVTDDLIVSQHHDQPSVNPKSSKPRAPPACSARPPRLAAATCTLNLSEYNSDWQSPAMLRVRRTRSQTGRGRRQSHGGSYDAGSRPQLLGPPVQGPGRRPASSHIVTLSHGPSRTETDSRPTGLRNYDST